MSVDDFYDVTLNLKSLANITEGFEIQYTDKGRKKVEELKKICNLICQKKKINLNMM